MDRYNLSRSLPPEFITDDLNNALTLRADLHYAFDRCTFVFVPKPVSSPHTNQSSSRFVTHVLEQTSEIGPLYHNAALFPLRGVQPEFLLARFAWAIFPYLRRFLTAKTDRLLLLMKKDHKSKSELVSGDDCWRLVGNQGKASKSRSISPRKRRAEDVPRESIEETDSESDDTGDSYDSSFSRKRRRSSSFAHSISSSRFSNSTECEEPQDQNKLSGLYRDEMMRQVESVTVDS
jgi:hypothetical protein